MFIQARRKAGLPLALLLLVFAAVSLAAAPGSRDEWPGILALLTMAQSKDGLLPETLRQFETWSVQAVADAALGQKVEQGWTMLASAIEAAGVRAETECTVGRDLVSLAKLQWLADWTQSRPRLAAAGRAIEDKARRLQDYVVSFSSEIEAPDRFFNWNRARSRVQCEVRLEDGSQTAFAPLEEEFNYPLPDDPNIIDREVTIENDPELQITGFEVRLFNPSSDVFIPAGVIMEPKLRLQFSWPEEHVELGLKGAGGMTMTFAIDPTRPAPLGFWATHFDELHQDEKEGEQFRVSRWETSLSGDPIATRDYSRQGAITERTTIKIRFEPKP